MHAELHFFHSGNGDTILVRGGDEWGLVDANFVERRRVRTRVEDKLKDVKRLRFVCITHFDLDHIRGLAKFLKERFSEVDRSGKRVWKIDQVITPLLPTTIGTIAKLKEWARSPSGKRAFADLKERAEEMSAETNSLLDALCEMAENRVYGKASANGPEFPTLGVGCLLFGPQSRPQETRMGSWRIACLGPQDTTTQRFTQQIQNAFLNSEPLDAVFTEVSSNATSRVLVLRHQETGKTVLLTGDSTIEELQAAMQAWQRLEASADRAVGSFHTVKVSHHGAKTCHLPTLYEVGCDVTITETVTSAEDDGIHPDQDVVEHVVKHVLSYRVTGRRDAQPLPTKRGMGTPLGMMRSGVSDEDIVLKIEGGKLSVTGGRKSRFDKSAVA